MTAYVLRRVLGMIPCLLLLLLITVVMVRVIPGNVVDLMLQEQGGQSGQAASIEQNLGLDRPVIVSYLDYVRGVVQGDLGTSLWTGQPVLDRILPRLPVTLSLMLLSLALTAIFAIPIGVIAGVFQDSPLDYLLRGAFTVFLSIPVFVLATLVIVLPAIWFGWTPNTQYRDLGEDLIGGMQQLFLPAVVIAVSSAAPLARITRTMMLEVLSEDFVRTARAKGLSDLTVVVRHALRNALIPVVTSIGLIFARAITGAVVLEQIFAIPGLGKLLIESVSLRDYPFVQAIVLLVGAWVMVVNLLIDVSYGFLDPRIRTGR
jgi:peptide/nickel transport system permease protein